jgi:predicted nucleotidyltransferase
MRSLDHLSPADHALLERLKQELRARYGDRLKNVILFGSRARGDARADSDWDVAVVVEGYDGSLGELYALADLGTRLQFETGAVLSLKPMSPADLDRHTLFMESLRDEGLAA